MCIFKATLLRIVKRKIERARVPGGIYKPLYHPLISHHPHPTRHLLLSKSEPPICLSCYSIVYLFDMKAMLMVHDPT